jgi:hypothetical protein
MDEWNMDLYHCLARERLERIRAEAERAALLRDIRPPRRALRVALGTAFLAIGRWVMGPVPDWTDEVTRSVSAASGGRSRSR